MAADFLATLSNAFSWVKIHTFLLRLHWSLFPRVQINNIPALVQVMAWCRPDDKALSEPMMVSLLMHICLTQLQWVKTHITNFDRGRVPVCRILKRNYSHDELVYQNKDSVVMFPMFWCCCNLVMVQSIWLYYRCKKCERFVVVDWIKFVYFQIITLWNLWIYQTYICIAMNPTTSKTQSDILDFLITFIKTTLSV